MSNDNSKPPSTPKAPYDPGWNDPPMFSYATAPPSASGKAKLNLNKRVAFPMQSANSNVPITTTSKTPLASSGLPLPFSGSIVKPPANFGIPPPSSSTSNSSGNLPPPPPSGILHASTIAVPTEVPKPKPMLQEFNHNFDEHQNYIFNILDGTIASLSDTNNTHEFKEIIKRIELLKLSFTSLDPKIKSILYSISNAIENRNVQEATNFHRSLAVDYLNVCSQWAPALRQLILLIAPNDIVNDNKSELDNQVPLYGGGIYNPSEVKMIPAGQEELGNSQEGQKSSASKHNFSKIYHI